MTLDPYITAKKDDTIQAIAPIEDGDESAYKNSSRLYSRCWCSRRSTCCVSNLTSANEMDDVAVFD
jgi:hypothetical protein